MSFKKNKDSKYVNNENDIRTISDIDLRLKSFKEQIKADDFSPIKPIFKDFSQHSQICLLVLNDLHIGAPGCNIDKIVRYLKQVKYIPNCYIILNGDLMNNANNLGKSSPLENNLSPMNEQKVIHTLLSDPIIKEKIICSTSGNHESGARAKDSGLDALATPMASLNLLDIYARYMARIVLRIKCPYTSNGYTDFKILVRHGSGMGGQAGKVIDEMFEICKKFGNYDMVIQGHTHKNIYSNSNMIVQNSAKSTIMKAVTPINIPSLEESSQYAMEAGYPAPNTDNSLLCIRAVENYDALDNYLNDGYKVLPYKFNIDTISMDRPEFVAFAEKKFDFKQEKTKAYLDKVAKKVSYQATVRYKDKKQNTCAKEEDMEREV